MQELGEDGGVGKGNLAVERVDSSNMQGLRGQQARHKIDVSWAIASWRDVDGKLCDYLVCSGQCSHVECYLPKTHRALRQAASQLVPRQDGTISLLVSPRAPDASAPPSPSPTAQRSQSLRRYSSCSYACVQVRRAAIWDSCRTGSSSRRCRHW